MTTKDWIDVISTVLNTIVLVAGGIFAYFKFIRERPLEVQANISQEILSKRLNAKFTLIHVQVTIDNAGTAVLPVYEGYTCALQVYPLHVKIAGRLDEYFATSSGALPASSLEEWMTNRPEKDNHVFDESWLQVDWPIITERYHQYRDNEFEIGAGETEHFGCDLLIPVNVDTIAVYSSFYFDENEGAPLWEVTTYHDIQHEGASKS